MWKQLVLLFSVMVGTTVSSSQQHAKKNKLQQFKKDMLQDLHRKTAEIVDLKENFEELEKSFFEVFSTADGTKVSKPTLKDHDHHPDLDADSFKSLKYWVKTTQNELAADIKGLRQILSQYEIATNSTINGLQNISSENTKDFRNLWAKFENISQKMKDLGIKVDHLKEYMDKCQKGEPGTGCWKGVKGEPGPKGPKGDAVSLGAKGEPGSPGVKGEKGQNGLRGSKGQSGFERMGLPSFNGLPGDTGPEGPRGPQGFPGLKGEKGKDGITTLSLQDFRDNGVEIVHGLKGERGSTGLPGPPGWPEEGVKGSKGNQGAPGRKGYMGDPGFPGLNGIPGPPSHSVFLLTRHSQSNMVPECPQSMTRLWTGYSLLSLRSTVPTQDLGEAGSCNPRFSAIADLSCNGEACYHSNTSSLWLSANESEMEIPASDAKNHVSRCVVCEAFSSFIAVHSQTFRLRRCPIGWYGLWLGYSFLRNGDQPLSSSGSCLAEFRTYPFIECHSGTCKHPLGKNNAWLANIRNIHNITSEFDSYVGRCQVCMKYA